MKRVVTIGGGTGTYNALRALKHIDHIDLHAIVTMADDGGSTGKLRDMYGVLPSGDIRRALTALAEDEKTSLLREIFTYRFSSGVFTGHNLGNIITAALENIFNDFQKTVDSLSDLFDIKGSIYPVTLDKTRIIAQLENESYIFGETNIDIPQHDGFMKIKNLYAVQEKYVPRLQELLNLREDLGKQKFSTGDHIYGKKINFNTDLDTLIDSLFNFYISNNAPRLNSKIPSLLKNADYIIFVSGDLYTSLLPNVIIGNCAQHISSSAATKIFMCNLFTKYGETTGFSLSDFLIEYERYLGSDIFDYILIHDWDAVPIPTNLKNKYRSENKDPIVIDIADNRILSRDVISTDTYVRHDVEKLQQVFEELL